MNRCGGRVLNIDYIKQVVAMARQHEVKLHLDGSRIWNVRLCLFTPFPPKG